MKQFKHWRFVRFRLVITLTVALVVFVCVDTNLYRRPHKILAMQSAIESNPPTIQDIPFPMGTEFTKQTTSTRAVPILMYHYIRTVTDAHDRLGFNLSVTPEHFAAQMQWLADHDYHTVLLQDFCQGKPLVQHPIILSFDDGHDDAATQALPILQQHRFIGTFFIVAGFLNTPEYLSTTQLAQLKDANMELGAHTIKHIDLSTASLGRQQQEISGSKQSSPVFAYPAGKYTNDTANIVKQDGFVCAVTTKYGIANEKSPLYELPRVRISGGDNEELFVRKVTGKL